MKHTFFLLFLALAFSTPRAEAQDKIAFFDQINISGKVRLILSTGSAASIRIVDGEENEVKYEVERGVLKIARKELWNPASYEEMIQVEVVYTRVREINASAGAFVEHGEVMKNDDITFYFDTGASGTFTVQTGRIEASAGEGGILRFEGKTEVLDARTMTGGAIKAGDLEATRAYTRASTGGFISVMAVEDLEASASIGGNINYRGEPQSKEVKTSLGGTVNNID